MGKGQSNSHLKLNAVLFAELHLKSLQSLPGIDLSLCLLLLAWYPDSMHGWRRGGGQVRDLKAGGKGLILAKGFLEMSW